MCTLGALCSGSGPVVPTARSPEDRVQLYPPGLGCAELNSCLGSSLRPRLQDHSFVLLSEDWDTVSPAWPSGNQGTCSAPFASLPPPPPAPKDLLPGRGPRYCSSVPGDTLNLEQQQAPLLSSAGEPRPQHGWESYREALSRWGQRPGSSGSRGASSVARRQRKPPPALIKVPGSSSSPDMA